VTNRKDGDGADSLRTITLPMREVRAAVRLLKLIAEPNDLGVSGLLDESATSQVTGERQELVRRARETFRNRRRRRDIFGEFMFGEPAWDMLLVLYISETREGRNTVGNLASHSGAPTSTAQRWIELLIDRGLALREAHPTDRRTVFIKLSDDGRAALDLYFSGTFQVNP
jgi:DNA-binding MarR family transcriptional regulator